MNRLEISRGSMEELEVFIRAEDLRLALRELMRRIVKAHAEKDTLLKLKVETEEILKSLELLHFVDCD